MQQTNQEIFDKALFGIRKQDYRRSANGEACLYRSTQEDGSTLACAVGHCIPDDVAHLWDADGHDTSIGVICDRYNESFSEFFSNKSLELLADLQHNHDFYLPYKGKFEAMMERTAEFHGLVYKPPLEEQV